MHHIRIAVHRSLRAQAGNPPTLDSLEDRPHQAPLDACLTALTQLNSARQAGRSDVSNALLFCRVSGRCAAVVVAAEAVFFSAGPAV